LREDIQAFRDCCLLLRSSSGNSEEGQQSRFKTGAPTIDWYQLTTNKISPNAIQNSHFSDSDPVQFNWAHDAFIPNTITSNKIMAFTVTDYNFDYQSITTNKIAFGSVLTAFIQNNNVHPPYVAPNSVNTLHILDNAINSYNIVPASVTSNHISSSSVFGNFIANNAITNTIVKPSSILPQHIKDRASWANVLNIEDPITNNNAITGLSCLAAPSPAGAVYLKILSPSPTWGICVFDCTIPTAPVEGCMVLGVYASSLWITWGY